MLSEFVKTLQTMSVDGMSPKPVSMPTGADPSKAFLFNSATKEMVPIQVLPPERKHTVLTLLSLANAVHEFGVNDDADECLVSLWCSMTQIVAVLDDSERSFRKDRVTMILKPSPLFDQIEEMKESSYDQRDLFEILTHDMAQALLEPAEFTSIISNLRFTTGAEVDGAVSQVGKNTFGKSVMSDVRGTSEIPKTLDIAFDPWPNAGLWENEFKVSVLCSVFVDSHTAEFRVIPQPGEIEAAQAKALDALCMRVAEVTTLNSERVFAGTP